MDSCVECGFTSLELPRDQVAAALVARAGDMAARLGAPSGDLTAHRRPDEWSPLEYACHVRDVLCMQRDRVFVALVEDEPSFKPMYREQRVGFDRYNEQRPDAVAAQLGMAAAMAAHTFSRLSSVQWGRPLVYGYPGPERHDVEWVAHHTLHEVVHHLADIDRIMGL
jgi:S-DNA-T family DNA segregation ATPase FtsK/SpoIIIE